MRKDVAIIGGGPAGYSAAAKAGSAGLSVVLFEKNALGGVCLNEGCIPTKTLLYSAKIFDSAKAASKYGVSAGAPSFDLSKIMARKNKVVRKLAAGIRAQMAEANVTTVAGQAFINGTGANGQFLIACGDTVYEAGKLLVCTGSEAVTPPVPGLSEAGFWTSREALAATEVPASLTIIGGGVIGLEFASFFNSLGSAVHVVEMLSEILPGMDGEMAGMLRAEYARRGIGFYLGYRATAVEDGAVVLEKNGESLRLPAGQILVSVGRRPSAAGFGIENLLPEVDRSGIKVNEYMQTAMPGAYACGDVTGRSMLAHTAVSEAETAVAHILGRSKPMSYRAIPGIVYTNPEIAGVGATEEELRALGADFTVRKLPLSFAGRFVAENEPASGLCKLLTQPDGRILGGHIIGNPASELIIVAGIAVERGMTAHELSSYVFPHPTVGEVWRELTLDTLYSNS
ncbi:MAG: dihydrolipoyl dehydrogenase [Tannerellaceae bacterium]|nr:dihydrolipoyl dehydrogenase [Tannerellaceae bacterium]